MIDLTPTLNVITTGNFGHWDTGVWDVGFWDGGIMMLPTVAVINIAPDSHVVQSIIPNINV